MIVEQRIYNLVVDGISEWERHYVSEGREAQLRHLPSPIGYYASEFGALNQVVSLWGYESLEHRSQCRAALAADPDWLAFVAKVKPLIVSQENRLLRPICQ